MVVLSVIRRKPDEPVNTNRPDALSPARPSQDTPLMAAAGVDIIVKNILPTVEAFLDAIKGKGH